MKHVSPSIVLALLFLTACASSYKPHGFGGGYSSTKLDENVFQVNFQGNTVTSIERAKDFTMLRSAELALQNGFSHFIVLDAEQNIENYPSLLPSTPVKNMHGFPHEKSSPVNTHTYDIATTKTVGGETYNVRIVNNNDQKPQTSNTIVCFKEKPAGFSYDAESVVESIRQKYN